MHTQTFQLTGATPGVRHELTVLRFGAPGACPQVFIQAALHADEVPALLVAQRLRTMFAALEAQGALQGEIVLVPFANPLGLAQQLLGQHQGRFHLADGVNFNRGYAELAQAAGDAIEGRLGPDAALNQQVVRAALRDAAEALTAETPAQDLKRRLLQLAITSDIVLDLHCDNDAVMHLYALTPQADLAAELGALLGAQAILLADESGDSPFDEACSRPWLLLQKRFASFPIPLGCFAPTVELRGQCDTRHDLAEQDARAIIEFLRRRGAIAGAPAPLPPALCEPTPLAASEPVAAPRAGVVVFHVEPGTRVQAGQHLADIVCPATGEVLPLAARSAGVLYARSLARWAEAGERVLRVAGTTLVRTGKLLSA
jgi:uncharacterized protein